PSLAGATLAEVAESEVVAHRRGVALEDAGAEGNHVTGVLDVVQLELRAAEEAAIRLAQDRRRRGIVDPAAVRAGRREHLGKQLEARPRTAADRGDLGPGRGQFAPRQLERLAPAHRAVLAGTARPGPAERRPDAVGIVEDLRRRFAAHAELAPVHRVL